MSNVDFINTSPLVLCGPLLRRVDPGSVTVWFALKAPATVTLRVYTGENAGQGTGMVQEGSRQTVQLGKYLHVVAVTTSGTPLVPGTTYRYAVAFDSAGYSAGAGLFDPGILSLSEIDARAMLLYPGTGASWLPTFVTPPTNPSELRVLHGSCRKPHGGGVDMLPTVDALIEAALRGGPPRPHQLVLTGDQIYADDVADSLLALIQDVIRVLELPVETLPDRKGRPIDKQRLAIGHRQEVLKEEGSFTSSVAKSHLLTFAEFAVMYLVVWSNVFWRNDLAEFSQIYPREWNFLGPYYDKIRRGEVIWSKWPPPSAIEKLTLFLAERKALIDFQSRMRAVRRAMAHVPTLMMFDDHEVTDDWYLSSGWCRDAVLPHDPQRPAPGGSAMGRRVVQNGLLAYALFQSWGNTPERFAATGEAGRIGRELLEHASAWSGTEDTHSTEIARLLGLPTTMSSNAPLHAPGALAYHYEVTWPGYQLIVLDTRTRRVFDGGPDDPPGLLLDDGSLAEMLVGLPDPGPDAVTLVLSPAPVIGVPLIERTVQPLIGRFGKAGRDFVDYEAWGFHPYAFQKFLGHLLGPTPVRRHVVTLGGDVHYGYAARVRYSAKAPFRRAGGATEGVIVQLTASALKNQDSKTEKFHGMGYVPAVDRLPEMEHAVGWANPGGGRRIIGDKEVPTEGGAAHGPWIVQGIPAMGQRGPDRTLTAIPDWQYTVSLIKHIEDDPTLPERPSPGAPRPILDFDPSVDRQEALGRYLTAAANHKDYLGPWGSGKEIVGFNNLGEVTFSWGAGDAKTVTQTLWWRLVGMQDAAPLTRYVVDLALGPSLYSTSGALQPGLPPPEEPAQTRRTS
ncbi:metallophosphoesterase family protein [Archangium minus]|uniref:Metallophosphoesterase family protein n=1 Tax=Archangium minus TaxID=83450 RepID=A0ABY9WYG4_9BACT|nr:metallophosphoesterase family protein [Archangium minus]